MGIYLNPGKNEFEEAAERTEIFVDKTDMIGYLNTVVRTGNKYVSVSRPRRFGKTMAADMVTAYYEREDDSRSLFSNLKLARNCSEWDRYLGRFDVIRLDMTEFIKEDRTVAEGLRKLSSRILSDLDEAYPDSGWDPDDLVYSFRKFYRKSHIQFVIVIDEWDCVFREKKGDTGGQKLYLDFLRDWLKNKDYVALAYMTGILPIKKYGKHSALNMFDEYSMITPMFLAKYTGFTEDEVSDLCKRYGRSYDEIKEWYDGYIVTEAIPPDPDHRKFLQSGHEPEARQYSIYSPFSVT